MSNKPCIVANISGFYGDRISAAREMLTGGAIDYLTGDYLAELTMAILYKAKFKNPDLGYARTFLTQMEGIMGTCLDKRVKVVVNAGGLNPAGLADGLRSIAKTLGIHPSISYIDGDDLMPQLGELQDQGVEFKHIEKENTLANSGMVPVSANAYMGCWGIVDALSRGADIVVTGRVSDTSVVMGPAAYHFGWNRDQWDALAGAATAGHIIECSGQAVGGNYSFFEEVPSYTNVGFPIAEIYQNGDAVITKHPNTGGLISVGTVTAQLMYEVNAPEYITPDVIAHFDTIEISQDGVDRVAIKNIKGSPATDTSKVTINCMDGYQNTMVFNVMGLDVKKKVDILHEQFLNNIGGEDTFDQMDIQFIHNGTTDPQTNEEAFSQWRVSVVDRDPQKAGKFFTSKLMELALCSPAGWCMSSPPGPAKPRIVHFPALIDKDHIRQRIDVDGAETFYQECKFDAAKSVANTCKEDVYSFDNQETKTVPLGTIFAARSGDKGGNANLGIWGRTPAQYAFLKQYLTGDKLKEIMRDVAPFDIIRYEFPNLLGLNFYIIGFLQDGVAASTKMDAQAKTIGEYLRMKKVSIPLELLSSSGEMKVES